MNKHILLKDKKKLKNILYRMYIENEMSCPMIGGQLNVYYQKIWKWLKIVKIKSRTRKEANRLAYKKGRNEGNHNPLTEEHKRNISNSSKGIKRPYNKYKKGTFKKGHVHSENTIEKLRNATIKYLSENRMPKKHTVPEIMMRTILQKNNINFIEQYPYKYGVADFFISDYNLIIEVDGEYWHNYLNGTERDKKQTEYLLKNGYIMARVWAKEVIENFNGEKNGQHKIY